MFTKLNLPEAKLDLRKKKEIIYVWDDVRKKELLLTPEEWVRQHIVHYFVHHTKTPKSLIALEKTLKFGVKQRRFDIVIYGKDAKPKLLVECKAPEVPLTNETMLQIAHYNHILKVDYLLVTNGIDHKMIFLNKSLGTLDIMEYIPNYEEFAG